MQTELEVRQWRPIIDGSLSSEPLPKLCGMKLLCIDVITAFDGPHVIAGLTVGQTVHLCGSRIDRIWDLIKCDNHLGHSVVAPYLFRISSRVPTGFEKLPSNGLVRQQVTV